MAHIACRWPGGMTLALMRPAGVPPLTVTLAGPPGVPSLLPPETKEPPSRHAATMLHKTVVDTVRRMQESSSRDHEPTEYGVTEVSGAFWSEWQAQNAGFDVVRHRMVFEL